MRIFKHGAFALFVNSRCGCGDHCVSFLDEKCTQVWLCLFYICYFVVSLCSLAVFFFWFLCVYSYMVRLRSLGILAAAVLTIMILFWMKSSNRKVFAFFSLMILVLLALHLLVITPFFQSTVWEVGKDNTASLANSF